MTRTVPRWLALAETILIAAGVVAYLAMPHQINSDGLIRLEPPPWPPTWRCRTKSTPMA